MLQELGRSGQVAPGQLHLTPQRLRPGQERQPVVLLGQLDRRVELLGGRVQGAAEQADPAQHRQRVRLPSRLPGRPGQRDGLLQEADRARVAGAVAFHRTQVGRGLRLHRRRAADVLQGVGEPECGPVVVAAQEVHVPEFGPCPGDIVEQAMGQRDLVGFVQGGQALFV